MPMGACSDIPTTVCQQGVACFTDLDAQAIFVHPEMGDDGNVGDRANPVQSLSKALAMLESKPDKSGIAIAGSPAFEGSLTLRRPALILGGYDDVYREAPEQRPTLVAEGQPVLSVLEVEGDVYLRGLDITLRKAPEDTASIVLQVEDTRLVELSNCKLSSAPGASGQDGAPGQDGMNGSPGGLAGQGTKVSPGQGALNDACPDAHGAAGGRGGDTTREAMTGVTSAGGAQGGQPGQPGSPGEARPAASRGQNATPGTLGRGGYTPGTPATPGEQGLHGMGGGGGGGGLSNGAQGGGGGGGASGGCAATPGQPGTSGMPSVAIVAVESDLRLVNSTIITARGGNAGKGGAGAKGGEGASGTPGSVGVSSGGNGGRGGDSSAGADSGAGGDGAAGSSYGVVCENTTLHLENTDIQVSTGGEQVDSQQAEALATNSCTMK